MTNQDPYHQLPTYLKALDMNMETHSPAPWEFGVHRAIHNRFSPLGGQDRPACSSAAFEFHSLRGGERAEGAEGRMGHRVLGRVGQDLPQDVAWKSYTHLCIFSATPDTRGGCKLGMGWTDSRVKAAIAEAHRNNVKVLLCVGGAGTGRNFASSTADAAVRATFIKNIISLLKEYGFDGADMDWEELQGKNAEYVALHKVCGRNWTRSRRVRCSPPRWPIGCSTARPRRFSPLWTN